MFDLTSSLVYASFSVFQCSIVSLAHDQSVCCQIQFHSIDHKRPLCDALVYKNTEKRFMVFVLVYDCVWIAEKMIGVLEKAIKNGLNIKQVVRSLNTFYV